MAMKTQKTSFRTRGFGDNLDEFWPRYFRARVLDLSCVVEAHLRTEVEKILTRER